MTPGYNPAFLVRRASSGSELVLIERDVAIEIEMALSLDGAQWG